MSKIIDGKLVSANIREQIKERTKAIKEKYSRTPGLAADLVGEDAASQIYVRNKRKSCADVGIYLSLIHI